MRILALLLCLLLSGRSASAGGACPTSSRAFTGAPIDAEFFVFDGGARGSGLGEYDFPTALTAVFTGWRTLIVVADGGNDRIHVMTDQGFFQDYLGGRGADAGLLKAPSGLAMSPDGDLWVADSGNHRIQKFGIVREDVSAVLGKPLMVLGGQGTGPGRFEAPFGVAVDSEGNVYVADAGNHRVQKLSPQGRHVGSWGQRGSQPGAFESPAGLAVGPGDVIYVADRGNDRVQAFDATGRFLRAWGGGEEGVGRLRGPTGLAVDVTGNVYVADSGSDRVQKFDSRGRFLASAGCSGVGAGQFRRPTSLAFDGDGYLYVVDSGNHRIQKLGPP